MRQQLSLIAVLFLVSACTTVGPESDPVRTYTGTTGVAADFGQTVPDEAYDGQRFLVTFNLHNQGATDINDSTGELVTELNTQNLFYLERVAENDAPARQTVSLEGKSDVRPNGEETSLSFGGFQIANRSRIGEFQDVEELLQARICYPYKTTLSDTLCVENALKSQASQPLCEAQTQSYQGNGGPVAITKVENVLVPVGRSENAFERQELVFDDGQIAGTRTVEESVEQVVQEPLLRITVRNKGRGTPQTGSSDLCSQSDGAQSTVRINATLGNTVMECDPNRIRLDNTGKGQTTCRATETLTTSTNYQSIFTSTLSYTYTDTVTKDINIRQRPGLNR